MNWYMEVLRKYAQFDGRARRKEYWFFILFNFIVYILLIMINILLLGPFTLMVGGGILIALYNLALFIPSIAVTVRRLHDTNRSGWWILFPFVMTAIFYIVLMMTAVLSQGFSGAYDQTNTVAAVFMLLVMVAMIGSYVILFVFMVLNGTRGPNKYGADPKTIPEPIFDPQHPLQQLKQNNSYNQRATPHGNVQESSVTLFGSNAMIPSIVLLTNREVIVGRSSNVNVKIENKYVSTKHLSLMLLNGQVKVRDLSSSNGTYISGKKLDPNVSYILNHGDQLVIGSEDVMYHR